MQIKGFDKWNKFGMIKDYQSLDDLFSLSCVFIIVVLNLQIRIYWLM